MKLNYISTSEKIDLLSSLNIGDNDKFIFIYSNKNYKISENINVLLKSNINKFPFEISCLLNFLPKIKEEEFYFLDFNHNIEESLTTFLKLNLENEIFSKDYYFLNNNLKDDVSICFSNYRDKVLFSSKYESLISHGFPLIIKGKDLIFIIRFIKIFFDLNILNYNIEGIFAILLKLKYG